MRNRHVIPKPKQYGLKQRFNVWTVDEDLIETMPQFDPEDIGLRFIIVQGCIQFVDTTAHSIEI